MIDSCRPDLQTIEFQITWNEGCIIYKPNPGSIKNTYKGDIFRVEKNQQNRFPEFFTSSLANLKVNYKPICLTIYPTNQCNLACGYCYARNKELFSKQKINPSAVHAATEIVAKNCVEKGAPFILGFHGGNEPLLFPELITDCLKICRKVAIKHNLELLPFCTTNGVISEKTAKWAAQTFHGITLSWDGPADIHDRFRFKLNRTPTSSIVQRTAAIFTQIPQSLQQFKVRSTVTSTSVERLTAIVQYFHEQKIKYVEFYPVFKNAFDSDNNVISPDAIEFVKNFLQARIWAKKHHMTIGYAGSRLKDYHDKYCPILQNNLTLTPDGYLTSCFLKTHNYEKCNNHFMYGYFNDKSGKMIFDWGKLENIFRVISETYTECKYCFNYLHCAKLCPSICPHQRTSLKAEKFVCTIDKWIGLANILEAAGYEIPLESYEDCESFFSNINVKMISKEKEKYVPV